MTFKIRTPQDVDTLVRKVMNFAPADSFVVVPVCNTGAPFARIDYGAPKDMLAAFAGALPHWTRVVVALYGPHDDIDVEDILPGVEVLAVMDFPNPGAGDVTRDSLATLTAFATTPDEALTEALAAYEAGDGALAWAYLERAEALNEGVMPIEGRLLAVLLQNAVRPPNL